MKFKKLILIPILAVLFIPVACDDALDLQPEGEAQTADAILNDPAAYRGLIAKVYGGLHVGGQEGGDGNADITGIDGGFSNYLRIYWQLQELTTDEAVIAWNDGTIKDLQRQQWSSGNEFIRAMYSRISYQIALANEFISISDEGSLNEYGIPEANRAEINEYRTEARFLRAYSYYHALDLFGAFQFQDDSTDPQVAGVRLDNQELFDYIEGELLAVENEITAARSNEYGRADQAAVWMTLSKLYMNAEVYTGSPRFDDAAQYVNNVINAGYSVDTTAPYTNLFLADNDSNGSQNEFIWTLNYDGLRTQTFGGTTFLTHAPVGGSQDPSAFGINGGWFGIRTTPQFVEIFDNEENSTDGRELFYTDGQTKEIPDESNFNNGFTIQKFKNVDVNGNPGSDTTGDFVDIDFPIYRLADAYLMYAELAARGAAGTDLNTAESYVNILRERAYGDTTGNISASDISLDFILDERAKELHWETHRRQDLIRFNQFTTNYRWAWKGNVENGTNTPSFRRLFSIPSEQISLNPNLIQNPGY